MSRPQVRRGGTLALSRRRQRSRGTFAHECIRVRIASDQLLRDWHDWPVLEIEDDPAEYSIGDGIPAEQLCQGRRRKTQLASKLLGAQASLT
jgi:hypothetical protein